MSAAGKRAGIKAGTRSGLWSVFADAIDELRPRWVVIENVRGLLSATAERAVEPDPAGVGDGTGRPVLRAAGAVLGDLADLGYDAQWATVAASDVGAPHRRERVFILATDANVHRPGGDGFAAGGVESAQPSVTGSSDKRISAATVSADEPGVALLPTPCAQQSGNSPEEHLRKKPGRKVVTDLAILVENGLLESGGALLPTPNASDCSGGGMHPDSRVSADGIRHSRQLIDYVNLADDPGRWGKYKPAIRRWEHVTGQPAPPPTEPNKNGNPRLSAAFSEWLMGWPAGWVTDPAIGISRNDQLRCVGNGVVSLQAVAALRYLLGVATETQNTSFAGAETKPPQLLPTPCARDHKDGDSTASRARRTPSLGAVSVYFNTENENGATG